MELYQSSVFWLEQSYRLCLYCELGNRDKFTYLYFVIWLHFIPEIFPLLIGVA